MPPLAALALVAALALAAMAVAVVLRRRDGRLRAADGRHFDPADADLPGLAARVTLVQFSTDLCARCPQVRRALEGFAADDPGVRHVEVDLTHRPDLARRYGVLQTPTILFVDSTGAVRSRAHGVPTLATVADAIASI